MLSVPTILCCISRYIINSMAQIFLWSQSNVSQCGLQGQQESQLHYKGLTSQRPTSFIYMTYVTLRASELEIYELPQIPLIHKEHPLDGWVQHLLFTHPFMQLRGRAESNSQTSQV